MAVNKSLDWEIDSRLKASNCTGNISGFILLTKNCDKFCELLFFLFYYC